MNNYCQGFYHPFRYSWAREPSLGTLETTLAKRKPLVQICLGNLNLFPYSLLYVFGYLFP